MACAAKVISLADLCFGRESSICWRLQSSPAMMGQDITEAEEMALADGLCECHEILRAAAPATTYKGVVVTEVAAGLFAEAWLAMGLGSAELGPSTRSSTCGRARRGDCSIEDSIQICICEEAFKEVRFGATKSKMLVMLVKVRSVNSTA